MRRLRLILLGGLMALAPFGAMPTSAGACDKPINNSCTPPGCRLVAPDPQSGHLSPFECYY